MVRGAAIPEWLGESNAQANRAEQKQAFPTLPRLAAGCSPGVTVAFFPNHRNVAVAERLHETTPPGFPESDDSAVRDQDRPETHSTLDTAFARRNGAYRPEQIMEARQNGWRDQPLANSDHHPGLYTGSNDPLMWGTSVANIGLRRGRYRPALGSSRVAQRRSSRSRFNSATPADVAGVRIRIDPWLSPASRCRCTYEHHHLAAPLPSPGWTSPRTQTCMTVRR